MRYRVNRAVHYGTTAENARAYVAGDIIDLGEEHARPLLESDAIEPEHPPFAIEINPAFLKKEPK